MMLGTEYNVLKKTAGLDRLLFFGKFVDVEWLHTVAFD